MKHSFAVLAAAALVLPLSGGAHEGEDHGAPAAAAPAVAAGPRTEAQTEALELVAVLADKGLTLYLDRFDSNEPVADAQVEVESGAFRAVATQAAPGRYTVPAGPFSPPGRYPLVISVQAGDVADLLTATLEVAQPAVVAEQNQLWAAWWDARTMASGAGALLLASIGVVAARRRHRQACTQADAAETSGHA
jgi:hypothetical protein